MPEETAARRARLDLGVQITTGWICSADEALTERHHQPTAAYQAAATACVQSLGVCPSTRVGDSCNVEGGTLIGRHVPTLQRDVAVSSPTFPRGKGGWAASSDSEVDPAPANSQSRLLIAQLMAPLGLHAGDEYDAKEFGRGSSQRCVPTGDGCETAAAELIFVLGPEPSLGSVSARCTLSGQALLSGDENWPGLDFDPTPWTWTTWRYQPSAWYLCEQADVRGVEDCLRGLERLYLRLAHPRRYWQCCIAL